MEKSKALGDISVTQKSGLLGPNPTGLIGITGLLLCAVILFIRMNKVKESVKDDWKGS